MRYVQLGQSDLTVSEVGFGGIPLIRLGTDEAVRVVRHAFSKGINFFDTANAYQDSEAKIGIALEGVRHQAIIATKTGRRDGAGVVDHMENSLRKLRTDYIDLYQLHQVAQEKDWEAAIAPGGALEAAVKAKEQGKIRYIGITSHSLPMAIKMIQTGYFTTVQFPFNFIEEAAAEELFPLAEKLGLGIIAMKPFAGGVIDNASIVFRYLREYSSVVPIPGYDSIDTVDEIVAIYNQPNEVTEADLSLMNQYREQLGKEFCRRCEYCQPCPNQVKITPAMGYKVVTARMSKVVAVKVSGPAMETIPNCTKCNLCISRCPYELPIPDMLAERYELYQQHLKEVGK